MEQKFSVYPEFEIPEEMIDILCPILSEILVDPVTVIRTGNTYEAEAILEWFENNNTDPLSNEELSDKSIVPNLLVKKIIPVLLGKQEEILSLKHENQALREELKKAQEALKESIKANHPEAALPSFNANQQEFSINQDSKPISTEAKNLIENSMFKSSKSLAINDSGQQEKQNQLTRALLCGDFELVKALEKQGASFLCQDKDGCYPLVAAVYGCSLESVTYIEEKLKGDTAEQWQKVDIQKFFTNLDKQMPTSLTKHPTYAELRNWYVKYEKATWCISYDRKVLKDMDCSRWGAGDGKSWNEKGRGAWSSMTSQVAGGRRLPNYVNKTDEALYCPSIAAHEDAVKVICEDLNALKQMVEMKLMSQNQHRM